MSDPEIYSDEPAEDEDQLQPSDTLADSDLEDVLDRGYSPPDYPPPTYKDFPTGAEQLEGASLGERLAEERPEPDPYVEARLRAEAAREDENALPEDRGIEEQDERAGRLVQPDEGQGADVDSQEVAEDVGIDGAGASAEEAAMHYTREP